MAKDTGKKLADMMYGQNPEQAAFGFFPHMKPRRTRQDPEAAKNFPVDLARGAIAGVYGMPGDVESLVRLPYELITGKESPTILPTSEEILKRLPYGSDTPVGQFASGLGSLAGGFYVGPGSAARGAYNVAKDVRRAAAPSTQAAPKVPSIAGIDDASIPAPYRTQPTQPQGLTYDTAQEGPFYRVRPSLPQATGRQNIGTKEAAGQPQGVVGPTGGDVPQPITDEAVQQMMRTPDNFVRQVADQYSLKNVGEPYQLPEIPESSLIKQSPIGRVFGLAVTDDPAYKKTVFDAYAKTYPDLVERSGAQNYDQLMEASYRQLAKETEQQFRSLPINMSYHRAGEGNYDNSKELLRDIYGNRHMYVYQGGDPHDFLNAVDPATGLNTNEMFRAVHDFFGHAIHGNQFGPKGEEIAWAAHSKMFSPLARIAMTSETRGQNSFVNYTPLNAALKAKINELNGQAYEARRRGQTDMLEEINKDLAEAWQQFQFAPQKSVILPPEFLDLNYRGGMPGYLQPLVKPEPGTTVSSQLTHFSKQPGLTQTDPRMYGTGIKGEEMMRLKDTPGAVTERTYFYAGDPMQITPEPGLGPYRYAAESSGLYDVAADPLKLRTLSAETQRMPYTSPVNPGMVTGSPFTDVERLAKEYGYEGILNPSLTKPTATIFQPKPVRPFAKGGIVKGALQAIQKAAGEAGMKKPVVAEKELTTLQDTHTALGDRIRMEAELAKRQMEGFDYKYDAGQRVFTKDSAGKNKPPYEILRRTRVGNQIMYDTSGGGMKPIIDPETGKAKRTPYEPGYRVRSQRGDEWSEFDVPQSAIVGDVEMAKGGAVMPAAKIDGGEFVKAAEKYGLDLDNATLNRIVNLVNQGMSVDQAAMKVAGIRKVHVSDNPDTMAMELAGGGDLNKDKSKAAFGVYTTGKKYQAAKKRAEEADVNLLKDPKTYAAVQAFLGTPPDELGFSVMHPEYEEIRRVADPAFYAGTALGIAPVVQALKAPAAMVGRAGERIAEKAVPAIMERGGLGAETLGALAQGSRSYAQRPAFTPKQLQNTADKMAEKIKAENPKLSDEEVARKALRQAEQKMKWEKVDKPALEKTYGALEKAKYSASLPERQRNVPEVVQQRIQETRDFLSQPVEPWTPPRKELQAFERERIKDALEGFPGVEQTRFPRYQPARADVSHIEEVYNDPVNRELIKGQIERGLPLGGETFYASLYPMKLAALERGIPEEKFNQFIYSVAPASARNSIMNEMAVGQFLRDMNARGLPLDEATVTKEMAAFKEKYGTGLPLMPVHREGVKNVLEGGQDMREMLKADIPTNYKIPTYGTQKAGDFGKSMVLDVHESAGQTRGSRYHPYFTEQGGFGPTEYGLAESKMLDIAGEMGIPGGMAQAGRWFGGGELTGLKSPRGDALDLLERQAAYTLQGLGIKPTPRNIRNYVLDMMESGKGVLMPWYKKEGMPDLRVEKKKGGAVRKAAGGEITADDLILEERRL